MIFIRLDCGVVMEYTVNSKKTEEVISTKQVKLQHPPLNLGNDKVVRKSWHKHLSMILDSELNIKGSYSWHISESK